MRGSRGVRLPHSSAGFPCINKGPQTTEVLWSPCRCALTHLLGEAVWPPRGGNELLQTSLLHTQWALNVEEHNRTEHIKAAAKLKEAQEAMAEKGWGMSPEL